MKVWLIVVGLVSPSSESVSLVYYPIWLCVRVHFTREGILLLAMIVTQAFLTCQTDSVSDLFYNILVQVRTSI